MRARGVGLDQKTSPGLVHPSQRQTKDQTEDLKQAQTTRAPHAALSTALNLKAPTMTMRVIEFHIFLTDYSHVILLLLKQGFLFIHYVGISLGKCSLFGTVMYFVNLTGNIFSQMLCFVKDQPSGLRSS